MEQIARVTKVFTKGFVKIALKDGQGVCGKSCSLCPGSSCPALNGSSDRAVAEDTFDTQYGDIVVVQPRGAWKDRRALLAYLVPAVMTLLGCYIGISKGWSAPDWVLSGVILGVISYAVSWIMNRRARLRSRMRFEVVRVLKRYCAD